MLDRKTGHVNAAIPSLYDYYSTDIASAQDMYPFGMEMPGRTMNSGLARFGFNGKQNDNEVYNTTSAGGFQDYGMRGYDPRLARFTSVDPLKAKYPFYTPYQFAGDMPTKYVDLDGCEPAENPQSDGAKEVAAKATVMSIFSKAADHDFQENLLSSGTWTAENIKGSYVCGPNALQAGVASTRSSGYVTDNTSA